MPTPLLKPALFFAVGTYSVLQAIVMPVVPEITRRFDSTPAEAAWIVSGFLITGAVVPPIAGRVGDLIGHRRTLMLTLCLFVFGVVLAVLAQSMLVLVIARMIQGLGSAFISLGLSIAKTSYPPDKVAGAVGMISTTMAVGSGLGLSLSGLITTFLGYHAIFVIPLIFSVVAVGLLIPQLGHDAPRRPGLGRINWLGGAFFMLGLALVLLAITSGNLWGWMSARTVLSMAGGLVVLALWVLVEGRAGSPLIDLRLFASRDIRRAGYSTLLLGGLAFATYNLIPMFLGSSDGGLDLGTAANGLVMLPISVGTLVVGLFAGRLSERFGARGLFLLGAGVNVVVLSAAFVVHESVPAVMALELVHGMAVGAAWASLPAIIMLFAPPDASGVAAGIYNTLRAVGGAVGAQIMFGIMSSGGTDPSADVFAHALAFIVGLTVAALLCALFLGSGRRGRSGR
ncbi:MFS transporter [Brevibacterium sp. VCM10]|uniref:MFS transporter n=1 Tax=Brevibacterium sp. VCM10 TaxID=1381751 RepID=UPI0018CC751E|nr:MFS transporter [Brevibacterium sp. VCM10]